MHGSARRLTRAWQGPAIALALLAGCGETSPAPASSTPASSTPAITTPATGTPTPPVPELRAPEPPAPPTTAAGLIPGGVTAPEEAALARANAAADDLGRTLRARVLAAMGEGGPLRAAEVCTTEARALTAEAATRHGTASTPAVLGRASLRMRSSESVAPAWVQTWLESQGERPAEGVIGVARIEDGRARVLRPIAIEAPCLSCHGEAIDPAIASLLHERYPSDRATGYRLGDLRGALYAEIAVDAPPTAEVPAEPTSGPGGP